MNPLTLKMALSAASSLWGRSKDFRERKSREAYDALAETAGSLDGLKERSSELFDDSRREAGAVTKAARARLEKVLADVDDRRELAEEETGKARKAFAKTRKDLRKDASKRARTAGKAAEKAARKKARKDRGEKRRKSLSRMGLVALILTMVGALYYWFTRRPDRATTPPKVQDFTGEETTPEAEARLVYSTSTPDETEQKSPAGDLAEDPAERGEELLEALDEQLEAHRSEQLNQTSEEDNMDTPENAQKVNTASSADPEKTAEQAAREAEEAVTEDAGETKGTGETAELGDLQAQGEELEDEFDRQIGRNPDEHRNQ